MNKFFIYSIFILSILCVQNFTYSVFRVSYPQGSSKADSSNPAPQPPKNNGKPDKGPPKNGKDKHPSNGKGYRKHHKGKRHKKEFYPNYAGYGVIPPLFSYFDALGVSSSYFASPRRCYTECSETCFSECTQRGGRAFECRPNCNKICADRCNYSGPQYY